jgi:hypothetical protein
MYDNVLPFDKKYIKKEKKKSPICKGGPRKSLQKGRFELIFKYL